MIPLQHSGARNLDAIGQQTKSQIATFIHPCHHARWQVEGPAPPTCLQQGLVDDLDLASTIYFCNFIKINARNRDLRRPNA